MQSHELGVTATHHQLRLGVWCDHAEECLDDARLTSAGSTDNPYLLPGPDLKVYVIEHRRQSRSIAHCEVLEFDACVCRPRVPAFEDGFMLFLLYFVLETETAVVISS